MHGSSELSLPRKHEQDHDETCSSCSMLNVHVHVHSLVLLRTAEACAHYHIDQHLL